MNPDQTAPMGAVSSGSILYAIIATEEHKQMREQMTKVKKSVNFKELILRQIISITLALHVEQFSIVISLFTDNP